MAKLLKSVQINSKSQRLEARVPIAMKALFVKVAQMKGMSLTNFLISSAQKESEEFLKTKTLIDLTQRDTLLLVETCLSDAPPTPNSKLQKAAAKFKAMSG